MKIINIYWKLVLLFFFPFCVSFSPLFSKSHLETYNFNFLISNQGWIGDFADYDIGEETFFELAWGWFNLPVPIMIEGETLSKGMFLSGNNHSDDLFMFMKRQIKGLKPNTHYALSFVVTIENNIPPDQFGIGGSPGESVFFKVGASKKEPEKVAEGQIYRLNIDKGNQSQGGKNAIVVGNLANPLVDPNHPTYQPKTFANEIPLNVKTDEKGHLWLFVGTDSGFEGPTHYYIADIKVLAKPVEHCNVF